MSVETGTQTGRRAGIIFSDSKLYLHPFFPLTPYMSYVMFQNTVNDIGTIPTALMGGKAALQIVHNEAFSGAVSENWR